MRFITLISLMFLALPAHAGEGERKILGVSHLEPIESVEGTPAYADSLAVARVEDAGEDGFPGYAFCTAAKVGEHLFLTNSHCQHQCELMLFRLGYEKAQPPERQQLYRCRALLAHSDPLDYALYEVDPVEGSAELTFPVVTLSRSALRPGMPLYLASHPAGRPKEIDTSPTCALGDGVLFQSSGRQTVKHMCDSEGGSSGAPLIDRATGHAVGLHWGGKDGQFNMAIPMAMILQDLQTRVSEEVMGRLSIGD